ncbi:hypothetical protein B1222_17375 [Paenibacillus larvae subsp. pulvifaciens]|nr:hypothetical protein B1222_17375 [Paenibacillus larvae subsp. pulvifaciens]AQZ45990.1 hypothetical protein B5S25_04590 [Paenibacillus larvae subsp. pulvifaciens]MBH0341040.1 hypothetical protein [Paenibacillus larvae]
MGKHAIESEAYGTLSSGYRKIVEWEEIYLTAVMNSIYLLLLGLGIAFFLSRVGASIQDG